MPKRQPSVEEFLLRVGVNPGSTSGKYLAMAVEYEANHRFPENGKSSLYAVIAKETGATYAAVSRGIARATYDFWASNDRTLIKQAVGRQFDSIYPPLETVSLLAYLFSSDRTDCW